MLLQRLIRHLRMPRTRMPRTVVGWAVVVCTALAATGLSFLLSGGSGTGGTALSVPTAAIRARLSSAGSTPFRIVVNMAITHLSLYEDGRLVFSAPAGVGAVKDVEIGIAGARISHGCILLHGQALKQLSDIPAGTPVDIIRQAEDHRGRR